MDWCLTTLIYNCTINGLMSDVMDLPEQGEIVISTISRLMDHGAYVTLDEYDNMQGFLHISEIAPGWIRSIGKFVKEGEKKVLLVKKVNAERNDIDLSLKQVSADQKKKKLLEAKQEEKSKTLMKSITDKAGLSETAQEEIEDLLYSKYNTLYEAFMDVAAKGTVAVKSLKIPEDTLSVIEEVCCKIKLPSVEIRGIMEITNSSPDGVDIIKKTLKEATNNDDVQVKVTYLGAPKYRLGVTASDFKTAERAIKPIISEIQGRVEKKRGTFKFEREESKKTRV